MTANTPPNRPGKAGFTGDSRGHVPFAVISVFLLVSSVVLVGYLQTSASPPVDDRVDTAMGQTDAAIQAALRAGIQDATERAGQEPLTTVADTPFGRQLDTESPFEDYLRALIYLETRDRLASSGQRVGDVQTRISLPGITDAGSFGAALGRVSIARPSEGPSGNKTITVTVSGVTTTAFEGGERVTEETDSVTVTVATPLFALHERTERFQSALDAGVTRRGLSQRLNARLYALAWARGYAQYAGAPVTQVLANRHVKPAVNDALYRTQKDIFGAADPQLNAAVRRGWLCMASQDAQSLYEGHADDPIDANVAETLCDASKWVFGDQTTGKLPTPPDTTQLLGDAPGMGANHTIGVNQTALLPLRHLATGESEHSFESVLDRMYTIDTALNPRYERPEFTLDIDCEYGTDSTRRRNIGTKIVNSTLESPDADGEFYAFNATVLNRVELVKHCWESREREETQRKTAEGRFPVSVELLVAENDASPHANIDALNENVSVEHKYVRGAPQHTSTFDSDPPLESAPTPGGESFRNYVGIGDRITSRIVGGTTKSAFEQWLREHAGDATSPQDVTVPASQTVTVDHEAFLSASLVQSMAADINEIQKNISGISHTFERREMVHQGRDSDVGPVERLLDQVRERKKAYLSRDTPYTNVGQKLLYEARFSYFELLESKLKDLDSAHDRSMRAVDDRLDKADSGIADVVSFLQQGMTSAKPDPVPIDSGNLLANLTYQISGSPTYFVTDNVTKSAVPQVGENVTYAPMATKTENYFRMPYDQVVSGVIDAVVESVGWGTPSATISFRTAGDALRAGKLAETAAEETNKTYADRQSLSSLTTAVDTATAEAIERFEAAAARSITVALYPDNVSVICKSAGGCRRQQLNVPADCGDNATCILNPNSTAEDAAPTVRTAVADALDSYVTTAETAIAIGDGAATERIIASVAGALQEDTLKPVYAENLSATGWHAVVNSTVRPAIITATADTSVTVESIETIKQLDETTRDAVGNVTADVLRDRLRNVTEGEFDIDDAAYSSWIGGKNTPLRVPAGLPLTPVPGYWFATANVWNVEANGQYARFEVTANEATPDTPTATTYVRENRTVTIQIDGRSLTLGRVEPIHFSTRSLVVVVVPPGGVGVGDRDGTDPECSQTWPFVGVLDELVTRCSPVGTETECQTDDCTDTSEDRRSSSGSSHSKRATGRYQSKIAKTYGSQQTDGSRINLQSTPP